MSGDVSGDLTGRQLGNYRIDGVLGRGGMSVLYEATDVRLGRKVALKVIGQHLGADDEFRTRFVEEARNTSAVDHANIVPLYDFGELDGLLYIAMRYVEGADLAGISAGAPMDPDRVTNLLDQVADALDTLHRDGLVHLDVKPANVLVSNRHRARDHVEHVYLADFGLTERDAATKASRKGDFLGSPTYAAPEHLRGEPLDGRTDQYALACMLYSCLAGRPPFTGDVQTVIAGHLNREPPALSGVVPRLPDGIDTVVRKGMAKRPEERYATCVDLVGAAKEALGASAGTNGKAGTNGEASAEAVIAAADRVDAGQAATPPTGMDQAAVRAAVARQGEAGPVHPQQPNPQQPGWQGPFGHGGPPPGHGGQPGQPPYGTPPPGTPAPPTPPPGLGTPPQGAGPGFGTPPGMAQPGMQPGGPPPGGPQPGGFPGGPSGPEGGKGGKRWIWAVVAAVVVVAAAVTAIFVFTGGEDESEGGGGNEGGTSSTVPHIPVGPGGSQSADPGESEGNNNPPPTEIPIEPGDN